MTDVTAIGELLIDFAATGVDERGYPQMQANAGGAPCNLLAALSKYGRRTAFIGKVGDDAFGALLRGTLEKAGIDTRALITDARYFTTLAFVTFDEGGDRSFSFARKPGADTQLSFDEIDLSLIDETAVLHFGTLSLTDEPARTATKRTVEYAIGRGKLISFDPNLRKPLWKSENEAMEQMLWGLRHADVVKISDEEIASPYCDQLDILFTLNDAAIDKFESQLRPGGLLAACLYSGGPNGDGEKKAVLAWLERLPLTRYTVLEARFANWAETAPLPCFVLKNP